MFTETNELIIKHILQLYIVYDLTLHSDEIPAEIKTQLWEQFPSLVASTKDILQNNSLLNNTDDHYQLYVALLLLHPSLTSYANYIPDLQSQLLHLLEDSLSTHATRTLDTADPQSTPEALTLNTERIVLFSLLLMNSGHVTIYQGPLPLFEHHPKRNGHGHHSCLFTLSLVFPSFLPPNTSLEVNDSIWNNRFLIVIVPTSPMPSLFLCILFRSLMESP